MSNTLLDSMGSRNKQFSVMTLPASVQPKPPVQPLPAAEIKPQNEIESKDKTKKLLFALGGLAVIGAGSVLVYKKLKQGKIKTTSSSGGNVTGGSSIPTEPEVLPEQLKIMLKEEYIKSKDKVIKEFNEKLPEKLKNNINKTFNSSNDLLSYEKSLQNGEDFSIEKYETMRDKSSFSIRKRLTELKTDKDWLDLRAQRKVLIGIIDKAGEGSELAQQKLLIVNDLLVYKADPSKEQIFKNRNLMSPEDAIGLVKRDFGSAEEFKAEMQKLYKYDFGYDIGEDFTAGHFKLKLKDVFKSLKEKYDFARTKLSEVKEIKKLLPDLMATFKEKLNALAKCFRNSELMAKLHDLVRKPA